MHVELGGGTLWNGEGINVDPQHGTDGYRQRAQEVEWGWPEHVITTGTVDTVRASHMLEHVPAGHERINVFNEAWRVLKSGGTFEIILPLVGYTDGEGGHIVEGWWAYADPTHVSFWWFPESLMYLCEGPFKPHADYGVEIWQALQPEDWSVEGGWEGHATLKKP